MKRTKYIRIIILCWIAYTVIYLFRGNLSIAFPYIESELHISKASLGILGSTFLIVYGIGQLVHGICGDHFSAKLFLSIGLAAASIANLLMGFSNSLSTMVVCWGLNGWFQSMLWGPIAKTIAEWSPPQKKEQMVVAVSTSMPIGSLFALLLSGSVASAQTWRWIFWAPVFWGLITVLVIAIWFRNAPIQATEATREGSHISPAAPSSKTHLWDLVLHTDMKLIVIACFAQTIVKEGIALWAPMFFVESYGLEIDKTTLFIIEPLPSSGQ